MECNEPTRRPRDPAADQAFNAWFGRTLRNIYEPVIHEDLPTEIVAILKDLPRQH